MAVQVVAQVPFVPADIRPVVLDSQQVPNDDRDRLMRMDIILVLLHVSLELFLILPNVPTILPYIWPVR
jgi:hypothetical protein